MPRGSATTPAIPMPTPRGAGYSFFLDFDGTLVDMTATPTDVRRDAELIELLRKLSATLDGALALISGRPIAQLDALLAPLQLPMAGLHGLERRDSLGEPQHSVVDTTWVAAARWQLRLHVDAHPGLLLEDKGLVLALHYRNAPQHEAASRAIIEKLRGALPPQVEILEGDSVLEIRPSVEDKGTAIKAFMSEAPFAGKKPLFIGDDISDRPAIAAVIRLGGTAICVGDRIVAPWRLPTPAAVRQWLADFVAAGGSQ